MDHPLDDCRLKVARAKEQFNALHAEIVPFANDHPYVIDSRIDPETGDEILESANPPRFPRRWAPIVGEIAHNCRSSLDYLIGVLVREAGGEPDGNNAFPISKIKARISSGTSAGSVTAPEPLRKKIDALQPYQRGDLAYADVLMALRHLSDRDKHRDPASRLRLDQHSTGRSRSPPTTSTGTSRSGSCAKGESMCRQSSSVDAPAPRPASSTTRKCR